MRCFARHVSSCVSFWQSLNGIIVTIFSSYEKWHLDSKKLDHQKLFGMIANKNRGFLVPGSKLTLALDI